MRATPAISDPTPAAPRGRSRALLAALAGAAALGAIAAAALDAGATAEPDPAQAAPPLPGPAPTCRAQPRDRARRARTALRTAVAKVARYPYAPAEGIAALASLHEAASCFELAGDRPAAAAATARANALRARLAGDYRDHLVRYRRALTSDRPQRALPEIAFLLQLLAGEPGPFTAGLRRQQLELEHQAQETTP